MVQMKERLKHLIRNSANILYIPHGSDERDEAIHPYSFFGSFISHMVQMKDDMFKLLQYQHRLYIPHGSDERKNA